MALIVVVFILVTVYVRPHGRHRILSVLEITSLVVVFLTLWAGMVFNSRPRCADRAGGTLPWCDLISVVIGILNITFVVLVAICFLSLKGLCQSCGCIQRGVALLSRAQEGELRVDVQDAIRERTFNDPRNKENVENPLHVRSEAGTPRSLELAQIHPRFHM